MSETQSGKSPLGRLVLFMFCLAVVGSFVAGMHYYAVDLPAQQNLKAPENFQGQECFTVTCLPKGNPERCDGFCANKYPENQFDACVEECVQWMTS